MIDTCLPDNNVQQVAEWLDHCLCNADLVQIQVPLCM